MKNLKYTKTFASIVLAGVLLTSCHGYCDVEEEHYHIYSRDGKALYSMDEDVDDYHKNRDYVLLNDVNKTLIDNNLFPLECVTDEVKYIIGDRNNFIQAKNVKPYIDEEGKLEFTVHWRLLDEKEVKNYSGIAREGNVIKYIVYTLGSDSKLNRVEVDSLDDLGDNYYINLDEFILIEDANEKVFNDGKVYIRK